MDIGNGEKPWWASNIEKARKAIPGLTHEKLARQLGVRPRTVSRWEQGKNAPSARVAPKLARALRLSVVEVRPTPPDAEAYLALEARVRALEERLLPDA